MKEKTRVDCTAERSDLKDVIEDETVYPLNANFFVQLAPHAEKLPSSRDMIRVSHLSERPNCPNLNRHVTVICSLVHLAILARQRRLPWPHVCRFLVGL